MRTAEEILHKLHEWRGFDDWWIGIGCERRTDLIKKLGEFIGVDGGIQRGQGLSIAECIAILEAEPKLDGFFEDITADRKRAWQKIQDGALMRLEKLGGG